VERLLHADTTSLDSLAKKLTPTASDLAQVRDVVGAFSTSAFDDVVAVGAGAASQVGFQSLPGGVRLAVHGAYWLSSIEPCFDCKITW
jgi:hypothetical protein